MTRGNPPRHSNSREIHPRLVIPESAIRTIHAEGSGGSVPAIGPSAGSRQAKPAGGHRAERPRSRSGPSIPTGRRTISGREGAPTAPGCAEVFRVMTDSGGAAGHDTRGSRTVLSPRRAHTLRSGQPFWPSGHRAREGRSVPREPPQHPVPGGGVPARGDGPGPNDATPVNQMDDEIVIRANLLQRRHPSLLRLLSGFAHEGSAAIRVELRAALGGYD